MRPEPPPAASTADRAAEKLAGAITRLLAVWRSLNRPRRFSVLACAGLLLTLFLPWYSETAIVSSHGSSLRAASESLSGWGAFSLAEGLLLLLILGVLWLLVNRAEHGSRRADGTIVMTAGGAACVLTVYAMFAKQGTAPHGHYATSTGLEFGIFVTLVFAGLMAYCGSRVRAADAGGGPSRRPYPEAPPRPDPSARPAPPARPDTPPRPPAPSRTGTPATRSVGRRPRPERPAGWLTAPPSDGEDESEPAP
jgi:hypothetical protein